MHAEQYRVITFESNMWGDHSAPTCSAVFSVDGTPPIVSGAAVRDVEPVLGGDIDGVDIEFTEHRTLRVGWSGQFEDPESAPDNILLFRIVNVTHGSPDGPAVPGVESDDELLAVTSTGYVSTSTELPLQDGERYFAHLGVCNVSPSKPPPRPRLQQPCLLTFNPPPLFTPSARQDVSNHCLHPRRCA